MVHDHFGLSSTRAEAWSRYFSGVADQSSPCVSGYGQTTWNSPISLRHYLSFVELLHDEAGSWHQQTSREKEFDAASQLQITISLSRKRPGAHQENTKMSVSKNERSLEALQTAQPPDASISPNRNSNSTSSNRCPSCAFYTSSPSYASCPSSCACHRVSLAPLASIGRCSLFKLVLQDVGTDGAGRGARQRAHHATAGGVRSPAGGTASQERGAQAAVVAGTAGMGRAVLALSLGRRVALLLRAPVLLMGRVR